jgi:hypothetical protein
VSVSDPKASVGCSILVQYYADFLSTHRGMISSPLAIKIEMQKKGDKEAVLSPSEI